MKAIDEDGVHMFFDGLQDVLSKYEVRSDAIYNMDETGFCYVPGSDNLGVHARRGRG